MGKINKNQKISQPELIKKNEWHIYFFFIFLKYLTQAFAPHLQNPAWALGGFDLCCPRTKPGTRDSNPGPLGEKRERCLSAMQPPFFRSMYDPWNTQGGGGNFPPPLFLVSFTEMGKNFSWLSKEETKNKVFFVQKVDWAQLF